MPPKEKPKVKKAKAKTAKSVLGGTGDYAEMTYEKVLKKDIVYVDGLINSRDPLTTEEDDFVDWCLNRDDGRALYSKFKGKSQGKCMVASCTVM